MKFRPDQRGARPRLAHWGAPEIAVAVCRLPGVKSCNDALDKRSDSLPMRSVKSFLSWGLHAVKLAWDRPNDEAEGA